MSRVSCNASTNMSTCGDLSAPFLLGASRRRHPAAWPCITGPLPCSCPSHTCLSSPPPQPLPLRRSSPLHPPTALRMAIDISPFPALRPHHAVIFLPLSPQALVPEAAPCYLANGHALLVLSHSASDIFRCAGSKDGATHCWTVPASSHISLSLTFSSGSSPLRH